MSDREAVLPSLENIFDTTGEESERYSVLRTFFEEQGIEMKTDLRTSEINSIVITELLDQLLTQQFGVVMDLKAYTKSIKLHLVSRDRKGRTEAMDVLKSEGEKQKGLLQKLMGQE